MSLLLRGLFYFAIISLAAFAWAAYTLSGMLLFRDKPKDFWTQSSMPVCAPWMNSVAYANLQQTSGVPKIEAGQTEFEKIDITCAEALVRPREDFYVNSASGMKVHYALYPSPLQDPPLFVHIHGVAGNFIHGTRYVEAARRMGFQLVSMDLSNHGLSAKNGKGAAYGCREDSDIVAVFDDLTKRFPNRKLYLHATSMGAMALANAFPNLMAHAARRSIVAASLENPISSVRDIVLHSPATPAVPEFFLDAALALSGFRAGYNFESCKPIDSVKYVQVPILVQWSVLDDLVPKFLIDKFMNEIPANVPSKLTIFEKGGHSAVWNSDPDAYESQTVENWKLGLAAQSQFSEPQ